jgi:hypothetical protein
MHEFPSVERWFAWAEVRRRQPVIERLSMWGESLSRIDLEIHEAAKSLLTSHDRPSWCTILDDEMCRLDGARVANDLSALRSTDDVSHLFDWAQLPDSLSHLRKMDFLGLVKLFRKLISQFGEVIWKRCPTAFASYASVDRAEVLRRVQGMRAFQPGLDIFVDFHSLHPGELWKNRLSQEIARRDRFFLFWSRAASQSEHVREEWRTALRLNKPITPVPVCSPSEVLPPVELAHLHFNDFYVEFLRCAQLPKT